MSTLVTKDDKVLNVMNMVSYIGELADYCEDVVSDAYGIWCIDELGIDTSSLRAIVEYMIRLSEDVGDGLDTTEFDHSYIRDGLNALFDLEFPAAVAVAHVCEYEDDVIPRWWPSNKHYEQDIR